MKSLSFAVLSIALFSACSSQPVRKTHTPYGENGSAPNSGNGNSSVAKEDLLKRAQSFYQKGDYTNAMAILDSTPEASVPMNDRTEYHNLKGLIWLAQKKPIQAESSFRKALNANNTPDYRGYYQYNLATSLYDAEKKNESLDILNAIDLSKLDQAHQHKVLTLKEKITAKQYANTTPSPSSPSGEGVVGSTTPPAAVANGEPTPIPAPTETYSGPVNRYRIGLLLPLSGKYENFGKKVQRAIELAFQHSSDSRAKDYELVAMDSGDTTESRLEGIKKLVENEQVIAIIGPVLSKGIEELAVRAGYYQVPLISIAQIQGPAASHLFSCTISPRDQAAQMVEFAMKVKGYSKFAILAPSNNPGEEMASAFWKEVQARKGEIKAFEMYDPEVTDFRNPVDKSIGLFYTEARSAELKELAEKRKEMNITRKTMKTAQYFNLKPIVDFDAVFIADEAKTVGQIIPTFAYRDARNLPYLGISSWNSSQLIQRAQDQAEGATFPVAFNTLSPSASTKAFYDLYVGTYNAYPGELDAIAFDAAAIVLKALKDSPSSRDGFRQALEGVQNVEAATGEVSIVDHHCSRNLALYTVQKGKFVTVNEKAASKQ
jgi:ABC-type branched-subunit amino acid transport system substrate-binding protein/Tfp pilus assembly protein PilF